MSTNPSHVDRELPDVPDVRNAPDVPDIDERLVAPGARYEVYDGELIHVPPADEPHGTRHSKVVTLVEIHTGLAFDVACDMLTRTSETSDVAPDVSVFPRARDPQTGGRQIEQLAFEVVSTETLGHAGRKAAKLVARGVRRVFAIDVERGRALEWSASLETWSMLERGAFLEDPVFAAPLPIEALVHAAETDDAVARALLFKRNAVIEAAKAESLAQGVTRGRAEGVVEGLARGKAEALIVMLDARGVVLGAAERARLLDERDPATLARWLTRAATCTSLTEVFTEA
jgi:Uma2 family endonuclease